MEEAEPPQYSEDLLTKCRNAYISRVSREILGCRNLLVATVLQREVPTCSLEITDIVRANDSGPRSSGAQNP